MIYSARYSKGTKTWLIDGHRLQGSRMSVGLWDQAREAAYIYATTNH